MKITFLREGHANNSSSSHSLIFVGNNVDKTQLPSEFRVCDIERGYFGEHEWVAFESYDKARYCLGQIKKGFRWYLPRGEDYAYSMTPKDYTAFHNTIKSELPELYWILYNQRLPLTSEELNILPPKTFKAQFLKLAKEIHVDSDSSWFLPIKYTEKTKSYNYAFMRDFCNELLFNGYAILGGSDGAPPEWADKNKGFDHLNNTPETIKIPERERFQERVYIQARDYEQDIVDVLDETVTSYYSRELVETTAKSPMQIFFRFIVRGDASNIRCVYDSKTNEWVLASLTDGGGIIKVIFDKINLN